MPSHCHCTALIHRRCFHTALHASDTSTMPSHCTDTLCTGSDSGPLWTRVDCVVDLQIQYMVAVSLVLTKSWLTTATATAACAARSLVRPGSCTVSSSVCLRGSFDS